MKFHSDAFYEREDRGVPWEAHNPRLMCCRCGKRVPVDSAIWWTDGPRHPACHTVESLCGPEFATHLATFSLKPLAVIYRKHRDLETWPDEWARKRGKLVVLFTLCAIFLWTLNEVTP